jgi:hypothetical protein
MIGLRAKATALDGCRYSSHRRSRGRSFVAPIGSPRETSCDFRAAPRLRIRHRGDACIAPGRDACNLWHVDRSLAWAAQQLALWYNFFAPAPLAAGTYQFKVASEGWSTYDFGKSSAVLLIAVVSPRDSLVLERATGNITLVLAAPTTVRFQVSTATDVTAPVLSAK